MSLSDRLFDISDLSGMNFIILRVGCHDSASSSDLHIRIIRLHRSNLTGTQNLDLLCCRLRPTMKQYFTFLEFIRLHIKVHASDAVDYLRRGCCHQPKRYLVKPKCCLLLKDRLDTSRITDTRICRQRKLALRQDLLHGSFCNRLPLVPHSFIELLLGPD